MIDIHFFNQNNRKVKIKEIDIIENEEILLSSNMHRVERTNWRKNIASLVETPLK